MTCSAAVLPGGLAAAHVLGRPPKTLMQTSKEYKLASVDREWNTATFAYLCQVKVGRVSHITFSFYPSSEYVVGGISFCVRTRSPVLG